MTCMYAALCGLYKQLCDVFPFGMTLYAISYNNWSLTESLFCLRPFQFHIVIISCIFFKNVVSREYEPVQSEYVLVLLIIAIDN